MTPRRRDTRRRGSPAGPIALVAVAVAVAGAAVWIALAGARSAGAGAPQAPTAARGAVAQAGAGAASAASSATAGVRPSTAQAAQSAPAAASSADPGPTAAAAATAAATAASPGATPPAPPAHARTDRQRLLTAAYALLGVPYKWGGKTPSALDCSGFTKLAYAKAGIDLPDGSFNQADNERKLVSASQLKPGDLVFYRWAAGQSIKHVTMYWGDGWLIGTGSPGQAPEVSIFPLADDMTADGRVLTYRHIRLADE